MTLKKFTATIALAILGTLGIMAVGESLLPTDAVTPVVLVVCFIYGTQITKIVNFIFD